jgi:hypothetical protein
MQISAQFILSLIGGILILAGGIVSLIWFLVDFPPAFDPLSELRENIGQEEFRLFQIRYTIAGLSTGIAVMMTSLMLKIRSQESKRWGIMLIILSAMSILGMGGFIIGMALGIIGGILAIMRSGKLQAVETEEQQVAPMKRVEEEKNMIFKCSLCDITFKSDEDLKGHIIRIHARS